MRSFQQGRIVMTVALAGAATSLGLAQEAVHTYTTEELDRKFGRIPTVSQPVDRSGAEDWISIQDFLDREYARIDADRRYDLARRATAQAAEKRENRGCSSVALLGYGSWGPRWRASSHGSRPSHPYHRSPHMKRAGFPRP